MTINYSELTKLTFKKNSHLFLIKNLKLQY